MKKFISLILMLVATTMMFAQAKLGYVDSEKVMASYKKSEAVRTELEAEFKKWELKFKQMDEEIKLKMEEYETRKSLMNEEAKQALQQEIQTLQQEAQSKYMQVMGQGGDLEKRQYELMQPLLDEVQAAIKIVREKENFAIIFDKVGSGIVDADESLEVTDMIIEELKKSENAE